ncbi:IclR family transcriptional regulator [Natronorubrum halophilum]|uniref:IclR family transcriptional regulator n=1 Tax=Natronorubrum halophilum TaxID=1702106 RepID=UPI0010C1DEA2|nr:IclR family transcriptional regulator [Natronorubrum halophilum]
MTGTTTPRTLATTQTSFEIIELLRERGGGRVTELAEELDLAPSTVHSHLATLIEAGYLTKEGDLYQLGLGFLELGECVRTRKESYAIAESYTEQLAAETNSRAVFAVEEHGRGVYVYTFSGDHAVWTYSTVGKRFPLHVTAAGKSILSQLPDARIEEIIDLHGLEPKTDNTITSRNVLLEELTTIDKQSYAINREEQLDGVKAVGVPVSGPDGQVLGAFSVASPAHRMKGKWFEDELPDIILAIANEFELNISLT